MQRSSSVQLVCGAGLVLALAACGNRGGYRVATQYTAYEHGPLVACAALEQSTQVPVVPTADRVLGDLIVTCGNGCTRDAAVDAVLVAAAHQGAWHVSGLACVRDGRDWHCVGQASAPAACVGAS